MVVKKSIFSKGNCDMDLLLKWYSKIISVGQFIIEKKKDIKEIKFESINEIQGIISKLKQFYTL